MSKFNKYARQLDEIARKAFAEYNEAEANLEKAKQGVKLHPQKTAYGTDYEEPARVARAKADLISAENAYKAARDSLVASNDEISRLRAELETDLMHHYAADPEKIDEKTLQLINSGIMKPHEYKLLMSKAQESGNTTMTRLIAKAAENAAENFAKVYGENSNEAITMRTVAYSDTGTDGSDELQRFDSLAFAFNRTSQNPAMISAWDDLTGEAVENF